VAGIDPAWMSKVVELVRSTREHADLRVGSSVRGAIDRAAVARSLADVRETVITDSSVGLDAALVALSGRVRVREGSSRTAEDVVTELWHRVFDPKSDAPSDTGKAGAPTGATH
jgi:MoxR-like ATPase